MRCGSEEGRWQRYSVRCGSEEGCGSEVLGR